MNQNKRKIVSGLPIAALLLLAIVPVLENTEWMYELTMAMSFCLFVLFFLAVFLSYKKEGKENGLGLFMGEKWVDWSCIVVSLVGCTVNICVCGSIPYFWSLVIIVSLLALILYRKK